LFTYKFLQISLEFLGSWSLLGYLVVFQVIAKKNNSLVGTSIQLTLFSELDLSKRFTTFAVVVQ